VYQVHTCNSLVIMSYGFVLKYFDNIYWNPEVVRFCRLILACLKDSGRHDFRFLYHHLFRSWLLVLTSLSLSAFTLLSLLASISSSLSASVTSSLSAFVLSSLSTTVSSSLLATVLLSLLATVSLSLSATVSSSLSATVL